MRNNSKHETTKNYSSNLLLRESSHTILIIESVYFVKKRANIYQNLELDTLCSDLDLKFHYNTDLNNIIFHCLFSRNGS